MAVELRPLCHSRESICVFLTNRFISNVVILTFIQIITLDTRRGYPCSGNQDRAHVQLTTQYTTLQYVRPCVCTDLAALHASEGEMIAGTVF
ncbi:hypothetical protein GE21DRAFT_1086556 [Neurospora crassa]|nr:hypothetical protein GE21DRAFT_1086556 [Neurospora crassa]